MNQEITVRNPEQATNFNDGRYNRIIETVDLVDFVNYPTEREWHEESLIVFPDREEQTLEIIRIVSDDAGPNEPYERVRTVIRAHSRHHGLPGLNGVRGIPEKLCFHGSDSATILTWLRCLARERAVESVTLDYWERNDSDLVTNAGLHRESAFFEYRTSTGREQIVDIHGVYGNDIQMFGDFE